MAEAEDELPAHGVDLTARPSQPVAADRPSAAPPTQTADHDVPPIVRGAAPEAVVEPSGPVACIVFSLLLAAASPLMYWGVQYAQETYSRQPWRPDGYMVRSVRYRYEREATWYDTLDQKLASGFFILLFWALGVACVLGSLYFAAAAVRRLVLGRSK